jgi:hypothetical protein
VQAFKDAVYGPQHDQEEADAAAERAKGSIASQKRKAAAEVACKEAQNYDWGELADTGKLKDLTVPELKLYLTTHKLPLTGKKELIINRILTHLGKWWSKIMSELTTAFNRIIRASFLRIGCPFGDLHNSIAHQRQLQFSLWLS